MTTFLDGPAAGQFLQLSRAPQFLRVTMAGGKFDALDRIDDTPRPEETIVVYRLTRPAGMAHVSFTKNGRRCGAFMAVGEYALYLHQPDDATARENTLWQKWATDQKFRQPDTTQ